MKNRELFSKDPQKNELVNNGVAAVTDGHTPEELRTLRHELETFVCDGQYAKGLSRILSTYIRNLDKPEQPAVWVSGFSTITCAARSSARRPSARCESGGVQTATPSAPSSAASSVSVTFAKGNCEAAAARCSGTTSHAVSESTPTVWKLPR